MIEHTVFEFVSRLPLSLAWASLNLMLTQDCFVVIRVVGSFILFLIVNTLHSEIDIGLFGEIC